MNWWHYLLLVNLYLALFYSFYALLLRKETFFQLNRVYLVSAAILSFVIPMIQADWVQSLFITEQVRYTIYGGSAITFYAGQQIQHTAVTIGQVLGYLYIIGIVFLTVRLVLQLIRLRRIINTPEPTAAYSFFKKISLGKNMTKEEAIVAHEQVHARQWHSVDVFIIEAVMIINWFNPVVYLYRYAIKHIHEFIADQQALKIGANKAEYALLLLSQTFNAPSHQLVNPFYNHSLLKKRIMMIQKNRSHRILLFKYVLSAPLFGLMLILSSATVNNSKAIQSINNHANSLFVQPISESINEIDDNGEIPANEMSKEASITPDSIALPTGEAITYQDKVFESVEVEPAFPGGMDAFYRFLQKNIHYPAEARNANIQGKVFIQFIVEKNGSLSHVKAVRGPGHGCNEEALRVIAKSPKWMAGTQHGKKVRVQYTVPINFTLSVDEDKPADGALRGQLRKRLSAHTVNRLPNGVYESVDNEPEFPGGIEKFYSFLARTVRYPAKARENNMQGKVFIQFIVEADGSLSDIRSLRAPSPELGEEAVRAMGQSPKWIAGEQNGEKVRVEYTVPVNFTLSTDVSASSSTMSPHKQPLYIIDGVEGTRSDIVPNEIESMDVLKDKAATDLYGERGANGVVIVKTKGKTGVSMKNGISPTVRSVLSKGANEALFVVDNVIVNNDKLKTINPEDIESMSILKGDAAKALYGDKGAKGVVVIKLKTGKKL